MSSASSQLMIGRFLALACGPCRNRWIVILRYLCKNAEARYRVRRRLRKRG